MKPLPIIIIAALFGALMYMAGYKDGHAIASHQYEKMMVEAGYAEYSRHPITQQTTFTIKNGNR